ncbi:hypothetical protein EHV15_35510 [Paenibacillus oralis]|uniref:BIG2 domain-containing protein n=2 Tax=Paenibacillus oralis TaxID=2490856 RepID=A0A3P3TAI0_9BACL|nr:hypothetical protein EHV15_35510 [Paenibacillus oralis]
MEGESNDYDYGGYLFSDKATLSTKPIVVEAPAGKIIKKLEWLDKSTGQVLRLLSGFTPGKSKYTSADGLKDTLSGTKLKVTSRNNSNYGGVYYWDRWSVGSAANWYGEHWRAGGGRVSKTDSIGCDDNVPTETFGGKALPRYPGCTDPYLEADIPRSQAFYINDPTDPLNDLWIKDGAISVTDVTVANVVVDDSTEIPDVHGTTGTSDPSTVGGQVANVESINKITIYFQQTFNNDTYHRDWSSPGAKQVWYFSKFYADFNSFTYRYKDKVLRATFADGVSGLEITGNTCVAPGGTTQLTATLTKVDGSIWPLKKHDKLTWTSSAPSIMTVNDSGLVSSVATSGTATITAHFVDQAQTLNEQDTFDMTVGTGCTCIDYGGDNPGNENPEQPGGSGQCTWIIGTPTQSSLMRQSDMEPDANGVIRADNRDSEKFDVLQGIPTSESLYINATSDNYLFKQEWAKMSGKTTYNCTVQVKYSRTWTVPGPPRCSETGCVPGPPVQKADTQSKTYTFQMYRDYSYWMINNLEVYVINRAEMSNYALPHEKVTMTPTGYTPPSLDSTHNEAVNNHVNPANTRAITYTPPILRGGLNQPPAIPNDTDLLKSMAESNTDQSKVNNDMVNFNGTTIMSPNVTLKDGPTPTNIPNPTKISRDVLYKANNMISNTLLNKANTIGTGTIFYELLPNNVNGGADVQFPINGINTVTVHTPTVNYSNASDDKEHN